ncbi:signal transduction histidine kinase/DNA-binding response OmpR family regulator [Paraburkholderia youngii]
MASCSRTSSDSDASENVRASTPVGVSETIQEIVRRRFAEFRKFFVGPVAVAALSAEQNLLVKRKLLQSLSRRSVYWIALLLVVSPFWFVVGAWTKTSDIYPWFRVVWIMGLWGLAAPFAAYLLKKTVMLPKHAGVSAVGQLHWAWAALVMLTSFWWAAASFGLIPPTYVIGVIVHSHHFKFARYGFMELTMIGQAITLLLLAPSFRAALGALLVGTIPFAFDMAPGFFIHRPGMFDWYTAQLIGYCVVAWYICNDQQLICVKEVVLEEARAQAVAAMLEKNQFMAAISHDLRQPLTTLGLKLGFIERCVKSTSLAVDVSIAQRQVAAMEGMINGALDICRLESRTWNVEIQEVALTSLLRGIVADMQPLAEAKGLRLRLHSRPYLVRTDRHALDRIVRNMVTNAVRYTPSGQGGKNGHVLLSCQRRGTCVRISVWDNGIGIPEGRQADIFKSYVQVDNPERNRDKGFGLGLAIVQGLANLLGHRLDVNSAPGRGSRFSVMVPFVERIPPELLGEVQTVEDGEADLTDMVVAIIEDNSDLRIEISMRLIEHGCYVVAGESSSDVIEQLRIEALASGPHFILSDYRLENEDGIAAILAVRAATEASIPAILWSGDTSSAVLKKVAASGMKLLSKPVSEQTLLTLLAEYKPKKLTDDGRKRGQANTKPAQRSEAAPDCRPVMASCTRTPRDSDASETPPRPRTSRLVDEKAHSTGRRRFADFVNLFVGPVAALSAEQNLYVKRELLQSLSRRALCWTALVSVGASLLCVYGSWIKTSDSYLWFRVVWPLGLWGVATPMAAYLLKRTMALPKHAGVSAVEQLDWAWAALVTLTSFWWAAGSFGLTPPDFISPQARYVKLASSGFLEYTLISHTFTLLLLAPSLRANLGSFVLGAIPFGFSLGPPLFIHRPFMLVFYTAQLVGYCLLAFFVFYNEKHAYVKEIILDEARERAETAKEEKSLLVAAISHDLRQPLTTLGLKLSFIERSIEATRMVDDVSMAQRQVDTMEGMINGALDICRLESGTWNVEIQEVALTSLLRGIVADMQPLAEAKGLRLRLHSRPYLVRTDRHALDRIVRNMVTNAVRYTPSGQGGKNGRVLLSCQRRGTCVRISVWDNGIGIPEDRQADIFKSYVQVDNPERNRDKGFGLGLAIVQGLANLLGHRLDVNSAPGRGSRFSVTVPFVERIPPELLGEVQTVEDGEADLTDMVVAIIEDNSDLRIEISMRLIEHGCYVVAGESSSDVIEQLRIEALASGPHFILSDYRLENEDGIAAILAVRAATDASIPAILWSGDTSSAVLKKVAASGMKLLSKPVSEQTLLTLLAKHKPQENRPKAGPSVRSAT